MVNVDLNMACRLCNKNQLIALVDLGSLPICHGYHKNLHEIQELFPYVVHTCTSCGLNQVVNPIPPEKLYKNYNYCFTAWKPEPHRADQLEIIKTLAGGNRALEIGCNDGTFLTELREIGFEHCLGVEPNIQSGNMARSKGHVVFNELLSTEVTSAIVKDYGQFDFVVSRHVIEHIQDLHEFFHCIDSVLKPDGLLMLDAPDCEAAIKMGDPSILWEEHVNYFTHSTLENMLNSFGYEVISFERYLFTGESLSVVARRKEGSKKSVFKFDTKVHALLDDTIREGQLYGGKLVEFSNFVDGVLSNLIKKGESIVFFGAGARGAMVINALHLADKIDILLDDQIEKHGLYMPGTGLQIIKPSVLEKLEQPANILLAVNNENDQVVIDRVNKLVKNPVRFASIFSPKNIWTEIQKFQE